MTIKSTDPLFPTVFTIILFSGLVIVPLVLAFIKTRSITVTADRLKTAYVFGLFPQEYLLTKVKGVKVTERHPIRSVRLKAISIHFEGVEKLCIDGRTLYQDDYIQLIKKIKRK